MLESFGVLNLWTYLAGVVFIIILPGPNTLYVLKTGVSRGVRAGYTAALGVFIGDAILIFCAYIGVASLIRTTPFLFTLVRFLGAIYLLFLGAKILYATFVQKAQAQQQQIEGGHSILRKSLTLSLTNPKAILFYVSFFVQFIDFNYAHTGLSFTILALIRSRQLYLHEHADLLRRDAGAFLQSQERPGEARQRPDRPAVPRFRHPSGDPELVIPPGRRPPAWFPVPSRQNDTQDKPNVRQSKAAALPLI